MMTAALGGLPTKACKCIVSSFGRDAALPFGEKQASREGVNLRRQRYFAIMK
jgi:hypothetical protein